MTFTRQDNATERRFGARCNLYCCALVRRAVLDAVEVVPTIRLDSALAKNGALYEAL